MASIFLFFSLPPHHHHSARLRRTPLRCSDRRVKDVETDGRGVVDVSRIHSFSVFIPKTNRHGYLLLLHYVAAKLMKRTPLLRGQTRSA